MLESFDLSDREIEILELLVQGASNKQIAAHLFISTNTVKVHLRNIFAKLKVNSRTEAAMTAVRNNLVNVNGIAIDDREGGYRSEMGSFTGISEFGLRSIKIRENWFLTLLFVVLFLITILSMLLLLRGGSQQASEDIAMDRWERKADLPTGRSGLAVVVYANQVYAIGGQTSKGVSGVMQRYDPPSDTWSLLEKKPIAVTDVKAAVIGERIYVPGGRLESGEPTDVVEVYDPILAQWSRVSPLPKKLSGYALVAFEGNLYLFGGWDGSSYLSEVYSYDPLQDQWVEKTPMLHPRGYAGAAVAGGVIYVIGGFNGEASLDVNEAYYPSRDIAGSEPWVERAPLPSSRHAMGIDGLADFLYVYGGNLGIESKNHICQYIPQRDEWQIIESTPINDEIQQLGFVALEGILYVMGGQTDGKYLSSHYAYQAIYNLLIPVLSK